MILRWATRPGGRICCKELGSLRILFFWGDLSIAMRRAGVLPDGLWRWRYSTPVGWGKLVCLALRGARRKAGVCLVPCAGRGCCQMGSGVAVIAPQRGGASCPVWPCVGPAKRQGFVWCPALGGGVGLVGLAMTPPKGRDLFGALHQAGCCQMGPSIALIPPLWGGASCPVWPCGGPAKRRGFVDCPVSGRGVARWALT